MRRVLLSIALAGAASLVLAQAPSDGPTAREPRNIENGGRAQVAPRDKRFVAAARIGLLPTFNSGGTQDRAVLAVTAQYYLNPRLALGLGYAGGASTSAPFEDAEGVRSYLTTETTHVGARVTGSMVRKGPFELYGGLQLGVNVPRASQRHEFPAGMAIENREAYLADRPDPFGESATQLSPVGFIGVTVEALPHVLLVGEIGNNLSLVTAGVGVAF